MLDRFTEKEYFVKFLLLLASLIGVYLIVAWMSYSPLDSGWSVASSVAPNTLNKTGALGAWLMDVLYAMFGKVAFLVPCALAGVPIYLLAVGADWQWNWLKFSGRFASFGALIVGLSTLAHALLSNTLEYLAGGFVGLMLGEFVAQYLGLFGELIVAMILTIVGVYFCSVQTLLQLGSRLYQWIFTEPENAAQTSPEAEIAEETPAEAQEMTPPFVEPHQISRPPIEGLHTEPKTALSVKLSPAAPVAPTLPTDNLVDVRQLNSALPQSPEAGKNFTPFTPETELPLPAVSLAETPFSDETVATNADLPEVVLPTIRLNAEENAPVETAPISETAVEAPHRVSVPDFLSQPVAVAPESEAVAEVVPTVKMPEIFTPNSTPSVSLPEAESAEESEDFEAELARQFAEREAQRLREMEQRAKAQGLDNTFQTIVQTPQTVAPMPERAPEPAPAPAVQLSPEPVAPAPEKQGYSYGETLIHPLLRQHARAEKPTTPLPTLDLLETPEEQEQGINEQEIWDTSNRLEALLNDFGVKATVENVLVGPVVTRYEIQPAAGTKATKITGLGPDLARGLVFKAIRITDRVPGKPYMGIEAPNKHRQTVWLRDVLDSEEFRHSNAKLPMALGKDISGKPIVVDMAKMPHLLVAGQTGAGKSVGVNTMILSLLYKLNPEQVRLIMIDPKQVELAVYNDIPHLLTPVVTDMKKAANALNWVVEEMERRYALLNVLGVRNIEGYNSKIDYAVNELKNPIPNPLWRPGDTMDKLPPLLDKLSYIVVIVDEFADLLTSEGKQVEDHIKRITAKARAAGIHLILATQRPSTDVITGVIKANIPGRIAFTVATQVDSRTILDCGGAESLLGYGDMLYVGSSEPEPIRVHGAFMTDDDVQRVADNWRARGKPDYMAAITESREAESENGGERGSAGELDPLFDEVVAYVVESNVTSIVGIQRRFSIGFPRAGKIVDQLEKEGILSAADNRGKRTVLAR